MDPASVMSPKRANRVEEKRRAANATRPPSSPRMDGPDEQVRRMRILVADDHPVVRLGIASLLRLEFPESDSVAVASGTELLAALGQREFDLIVVDFHLGDRDGVALLKELKERFPMVPVLVLSMHPEDPFAVIAYRAGALGYVNKSDACSRLADAIRSILSGHMAFSTWAREMILAGSNEDPHRFRDLSARESQIVAFLVEGLSMKDIAAKMGVSPSTVNTYRQRILEKIGGNRTADILRYGLAVGSPSVSGVKENPSCHINTT